MTKTIQVEGGLEFAFRDFISAVGVDIQGEPDTARLKHDGSPIVDIIAENDEQLHFIEAKNFVRTSADEAVQAAMDKAKRDSYLEVADAPAYAKKMIRKFEHSLFIWLASGNAINKPIAFILAFNVGSELDSKMRLRLIDRLVKYIPDSSLNPLRGDSDIATKIYFDMPENYESYGFELTVQS